MGHITGPSDTLAAKNFKRKKIQLELIFNSYTLIKTHLPKLNYFHFCFFKHVNVTEKYFHLVSNEVSSTSGRKIVSSKVVDERCQVQSLVALVDLAALSFPLFSPKLTYGLQSHRKTPPSTEGTLPRSPSPLYIQKGLVHF